MPVELLMLLHITSIPRDYHSVIGSTPGSVETLENYIPAFIGKSFTHILLNSTRSIGQVIGNTVDVVHYEDWFLKSVLSPKT